MIGQRGVHPEDEVAIQGPVVGHGVHDEREGLAVVGHFVELAQALAVR
ncbi:MAG: hypothetical protein IPL36_09635 [Nigerium sp.]|nr:hypothetical protein [Nigerium sp.]